MIELYRRISDWLETHPEHLPLPGQGDTAQRHRMLMELGAEDLSLGRLIEAHTDAWAILAEAGREPRRAGLYGVWASDAPPSRVMARRVSAEEWRLSGIKQYCSGASMVSGALVTAHDGEDVMLFDVAMGVSGIRVLPSNWVSPALADTATSPVAFDDVQVPAGALIGGPHWYLRRPGFWHGAVGPAACWAGGAAYLARIATEANRRDAHSKAHVGALQAFVWGLEALLTEAGRQIDEDPGDSQGMARGRALKIRHLIERYCTEALDRFGRATGPQLLAHDAQVVRQYGALALYIRQCHAERDLEAIPR